MNDFINKIVQDTELYIVNLNSKSIKDIDIAVFTWDSERPITKIISVLRLAENYSNDLDFFCKNVHYPKLSSQKPKLHLLLYPSIEFLQLFEPPSLIRHLQKRSKVEQGDKDKFIAKISNLDTNQILIKNKTILHYLEQSLNNLFYLLLNTNVFSLNEYILNINYLSKYLSIERERLKSGSENMELMPQVNIPSDKEYHETKIMLIKTFEKMLLEMEEIIIET